MRRALPLAAALAALLPSVGLRADPPDDPPDPLSVCVGAATRALSERGAELVHTETGFLDEGESRSWPLTLGADGCIGLLAVGHRHVEDLDLELHTDSGIELGRDIAVDAHPYLRFCGAEGLRLMATVRMYKGRGEYRLLAFTRPPETLPDLNRRVGECFASRIGIHYPAPDIGPDPEAPTPDDSLETLGQALGELGYRPIGTTERGQLAQREMERRDVTLEAGRCFAVAASGGPGVLDLDLILRQPDGRPLARDVARARDALVKACAVQPGRHTVEVRMVSGSGSWELRTFRLEEPPAAQRPASLVGEARIPYAEMVARLQTRGLDPRPVTWGVLSGGQSLSVPVRLTAGRCYGIGVIPTEAFMHGDLDLVLLDDVGALVAWELGMSPDPVVYHCPQRTAVHRAVTRAYGTRGRFLLIMGEEP